MQNLLCNILAFLRDRNPSSCSADFLWLKVLEHLLVAEQDSVFLEKKRGIFLPLPIFSCFVIKVITFASQPVKISPVPLTEAEWGETDS